MRRRLQRDDLAFWLWTSGSTGKPKAAVHQHRDWSHCASNYATGVLALTASDVTCSSSKLFHAYGLGNSLAFPLSAGAATVLSPRPGPKRRACWRSLSGRGRRCSSRCPRSMRRCSRRHAQPTTTCRACDSRSQPPKPLPADIFRRWKERFGIEILDGLGSTEVSAHLPVRTCWRRAARQLRQARPGYDIRVVDAAGEDVPIGTVGDMLVAGDSRAVCLLEWPELTAERTRGPWFVTGDKSSVDADGYYWYAGRADDMFKVSGQWISPIEMEGPLVDTGRCSRRRSSLSRRNPDCTPQRRSWSSDAAARPAPSSRKNFRSSSKPG